jgi:cytoskeletal protein RodZ
MDQVSKKGLKSYQLTRGPKFTHFPRIVFVLPLVVAICAALIIWVPHIASHGGASSSPSTETTKALVTGADGLDDRNTTIEPPKASTTPSQPTAPNQSVSPSSTGNATSSKPSSTAASKPTITQPTPDCKTLVKNLTDTLNGTKTAALTLLNHDLNLGSVGLNLGMQNKFIDGYNANIQQVYDASVKSAKDAGCTFTTPAPTPMVHKKLL